MLESGKILPELDISPVARWEQSYLGLELWICSKWGHTFGSELLEAASYVPLLSSRRKHTSGLRKANPQLAFRSETFSSVMPHWGNHGADNILWHFPVGHARVACSCG